jgi:hypothetical protein
MQAILLEPKHSCIHHLGIFPKEGREVRTLY